MGAVTAILFAEKNEQTKFHLSSLVLDSPFTDINTLAQDVSSQQTNIPTLFVTMAMSVVKSTIREKLKFDVDELNPLASMQRLNIPAVFHIGNFDVLVKPERVTQFYHAYPIKEKLLIRSDCDHGGERSHKDCYSPCFRFVSDKFDTENFRKFVPATYVSANTALMKKALNSKVNTNTGYLNDQYSRGTMRSRPMARGLELPPKPQLALAGTSIKSVISGPTRPRNPIDTTSVNSFLTPEPTIPTSSFNSKRKVSGHSAVSIFQDEQPQVPKQSSRSGGAEKITVGFPPQTSATILSQTAQVKTNYRVIPSMIKDESTEDSRAAANLRPRTLYSDVSPSRSRQPDEALSRKKNPIIFDSAVPVLGQKPRDLMIPKTTNHINQLAQQYTHKNLIGREKLEEIKFNEHKKNQLYSEKSFSGAKDRPDYAFETQFKAPRRANDLNSFVNPPQRKIEPMNSSSNANTRLSKIMPPEADAAAPQQTADGSQQPNQNWQTNAGGPQGSRADDHYARMIPPPTNPGTNNEYASTNNEYPNMNYQQNRATQQHIFEKENPPNNHSQSTNESIHLNSLTENNQHHQQAEKPYQETQLGAAQSHGVVNVSCD